LAGSYRDLVLVTVDGDFPGPRLLWRSDGTSAGTFPLSETVTLSNPIPFKGVVYLTGCGTSGCDLWKTDGSAAGTILVKDLAAAGGSLQQVLAAGSRLFFTAGDSAGGVALWSSDGTAAGTVRLQAFGHGTADLLAAAGDRLFFSLTAGDKGPALWT